MGTFSLPGESEFTGGEKAECKGGGKERMGVKFLDPPVSEASSLPSFPEILVL